MSKESICNKIWQLSHDQIILNLRFLDMAVSAVSVRADEGISTMAIKEGCITYQPAFAIKKYKNCPTYIFRAHLHMLFHLIFQHPFGYEKRNMSHWDMACDMACENAIIELGLEDFSVPGDEKRRARIEEYRQEFGTPTAARIYRNLENGKYSPDEEELGELFKIDEHDTFWLEGEMLEITLEQLKKVSESIKANIQAFSKGKTGEGEILDQLLEATKTRYDYSTFLKKFCVPNEEMTIDADEFDYIYYSYGLELYGNVPLIEPLEYKDSHKIREFVIAIDTSGSTRGKLVKNFLQRTYDILMNTESFFSKVNIHILQCDSSVQSDTRITDKRDFERFMKEGRLQGFGSTDFRPVFEHVNRQIAEGEYENLKGLIYFTDGFGIFPENKPEYDTAFVFIESEYDAPTTPPWAIKLVLEETEFNEG